MLSEGQDSPDFQRGASTPPPHSSADPRDHSQTQQKLVSPSVSVMISQIGPNDGDPVSQLHEREISLAARELEKHSKGADKNDPDESRQKMVVRDANTILVEINLLKSALPTQAELALVYEQNPEDGKKLKGYCRGIIRKMQQLDKERQKLCVCSEQVSKRQTIIERARERRFQSQSSIVNKFLVKAADSMDRRSDLDHRLTAARETRRLVRMGMAAEAEEKRTELEQERMNRLTEAQNRWEATVQRAEEDKSCEQQKASEVRELRIRTLVDSNQRVVFASSNGSSFQATPQHLQLRCGSSGGGGGGGSTARSHATAASLQPFSASDTGRRSEGLETEGSDGIPVVDASSAACPSETEIQRVQNQKRLELERQIKENVELHVNRAMMIRNHRARVAQSMSDKIKVVPLVKEQQRIEGEVQYVHHLQRMETQREQRERLESQRKEVAAQRARRNKLRHERVQRHKDDAASKEEERIQHLLRKIRLDELGLIEEKEPTPEDAHNGTTGSSDTHNYSRLDDGQCAPVPRQHSMSPFEGHLSSQLDESAVLLSSLSPSLVRSRSRFGKPLDLIDDRRGRIAAVREEKKFVATDNDVRGEGTSKLASRLLDRTMRLVQQFDIDPVETVPARLPKSHGEKRSDAQCAMDEPRAPASSSVLDTQKTKAPAPLRNTTHRNSLKAIERRNVNTNKTEKKKDHADITSKKEHPFVAEMNAYSKPQTDVESNSTACSTSIWSLLRDIMQSECEAHGTSAEQKGLRDNFPALVLLMQESPMTMPLEPLSKEL